MEDLSKQLHDILYKFGWDMVDDLKKSANKLHKPKNGNDTALAGTIKFQIYGKGFEKGAHFTMADYWEYAEYGRRSGKMPPINAINDWIVANHLVDEFYKNKPKPKTAKGLKNLTFEKKLKTVSFLIRRAIAKKGTIKRFQYKGSNFASKVLLDGRITKLEEEIAEKIGLQIVVDITEALKPKVKV